MSPYGVYYLYIVIVQEKVVSSVMTQWGHTKEKHIGQQVHLPLCFNHYWTIRYDLLVALTTLHSNTLQQIGFKNQTGVVKEPITREKAISLVKDVFVSAAERDIYTGDGLQVHVISADGIETELIPLRRD